MQKEPSTTSDSAMKRRRFLRYTTAVALAAPVGVGASIATTRARAADTAATPDVFYDKGGAVFNVKAYNAQGNGSADDTQAITAAIAAAQGAGGGSVYFPQGQYLISSNIPITSNGINLIGAGQDATVLLVASGYSSGDVITFTNVRTCSVRTLTINAMTQRTGGAALHLNNSSQVYIQDVNMSKMFIGCLIDGNGALQYIDRGYWTSFSPGGVGIWININGNDQYISNIVMDNDAANQPLAGVRITNSQAVWTRSLDILSCQEGLLIDPGAGGVVSYCFFTDCAWDTCAHHGILINPATGATVKGLNFMDCWSASAKTNDGCSIGGPVDGVQFTGHRFFNNGANGLSVVSPASNIFVDASGAAGNNQANDGGNGFAFNNCSNFAVRGCRTGAYDGFGASQVNGIAITAGCNNYIVTSNLTGGNAVGIADGGGPSKVVANNL